MNNYFLVLPYFFTCDEEKVNEETDQKMGILNFFI